METQFRKELAELINRHSKENGSNTPDFIQARYLENVLQNFDAAVNEREEWYDRSPKVTDLPEDVPFPTEAPPFPVELDNTEPLIDYDSTGNPPPTIQDFGKLTGDPPDIMPSQTSDN